MKIIIDGNSIETQENKTVLSACLSANIYVPHICAHPDLPPFDEVEPEKSIYRGGELITNTQSKKWEGCRLCVVEIDGNIRTSCNTIVKEGMNIQTVTSEIQEIRQSLLSTLFSTHPHACITCAQKEGCSITQCSTDVPEKERCCPKFGNCELQKIAEYINIPKETSRYIYKNLPIIQDEPLFIRDTNLCIGCLRCVRMCKNIRDVNALGFVYSSDGTPVVGTTGPTFKESECKFCGGCAEVCPTGAIMDKNIKGEREAFLLPCTYECPINIDVPRYIYYIKEKKFNEALSVIKEKTPFPNILSRICEHLCETNCRRGELDEPISICGLKRFVTKIKTDKPKIKPKKSTGKKIAIVGAGPAGLTAGYYLSKLGHSVTIFDSYKEPGGVMLKAIPRYRLPLEVLREEINEIMAQGIEFKGNTTIKDLDELKDYSAIFLAPGSEGSKKLSIEGEEREGVLNGIEFLTSINQGKIPKIGKNVVVIGGGNVAIDAGLSALRLGRKVDIFCLERWDEMPAYLEEREQAKEEGINIHCGWGPKKILQSNKKVVGIEFMQCVSVFDEKGEFNPSFDESKIMTISADTIIVAIGQTPLLSFLENKIKLTPQGTIEVDKESLKTSLPHVFAGGDAVSGPASVVKAIRDGRKAAISIDKYLGGDGVIDEHFEKTPPSPWLGREEGFSDRKRVKTPCLPIEKRRGNFDEVRMEFTEEDAIYEAKRCLRCDLRFNISSVKLPPEVWIEFNKENISKVPAREGVFQLLNEEKVIIYIKGTQNLNQELESELEAKEDAKYFVYEEEPMYTRRESELIQHFIQAHNKMPKYNEELEDLF